MAFNTLSTSWWQTSNSYMLHIIMNLELFQWNVERIIESHFGKFEEVPFDFCLWFFELISKFHELLLTQINLLSLYRWRLRHGNINNIYKLLATLNWVNTKSSLLKSLLKIMIDKTKWLRFTIWNCWNIEAFHTKSQLNMFCLSLIWQCFVANVDVFLDIHKTHEFITKNPMAFA